MSLTSGNDMKRVVSSVGLVRQLADDRVGVTGSPIGIPAGESSTTHKS